MSEQYMAELRLFPFNFPPKYWAFCNGQLLPIAQNSALFSLLGITYGGNGVNTFALPDLRGRVAMGQGNGRVAGEAGGEENHTLTVTEIPQHNHLLFGTADAGSPAVSPSGTFLGGAVADRYGSSGAGSLVTLSPATVGSAGGGQAHTNMQPYAALQWCICLAGIFPSRP